MKKQKRFGHSDAQAFEEAAHIQSLEGNPLDSEDIAMFEMFEREGWSAEQRRAYVVKQARKRSVSRAAE